MAPKSLKPSNASPSPAHRDRCLNAIANFIPHYFLPESREDPNFTYPHNLLVCLGHPEPKAIVVFCSAAQFKGYAVTNSPALSGNGTTGDGAKAQDVEEVSTAVSLNGVKYDILWKETRVPSEEYELDEERFWTELFDKDGNVKVKHVFFANLEELEEQERVAGEKAVARKEKKKAKKERRAAEKGEKKVEEEEK
ncbi:hypothetical protein CB0940_00276 [Cercospora beticola]|uniref:Uncharacterized protein n=1 Tax=Cercospora beticola TaxID=122368 RepID=A0A2G5IBU1_CERBT|nr:hypothetical protein CB0940_00276 [Cercospora beticola]PIB02326.1 hypothetical protein CB0940_00276 [Cercospora beticola]WPA95684.1 hypothetical protein RHO25_000287 [Cercospora beticola]CAK1356073.1 unnamed protein product [Cercospora beticola]